MTGGDATAGAEILPLAAAAVRRAELGELRHVAVTGSTNADLVAAADRGERGPAVLVADHQTAGRGRLDRTWTDGGRALLVSVVVPVPDLSEGPGVAARLGAALQLAVQSFVPVAVLVKWPNDLVVDAGPAPGKLAGLLAEGVAGAAPAVVVGAGCNLEPVADVTGATSIRACGGEPDRDRLLAATVEAFAGPFATAAAARAHERDHSATIGRTVRVARPGAEPLVGRAVAIDDDGRLVVATDAGEERVTAGDVVHVRTAD